MSFIKDKFIERFKEFGIKTDEIISNTNEYKKNTQLYHYTSLDALEAMIKSQSIRASSIFSMNDPNELVFGQEKITDKFIQPISNELKSSYENQSINNLSAFVFSLSELNDDMNQWEKYGDKHKGVRIGFTPKNLLDFWRQIDSINVFLVPVIYNEVGFGYIEPYGTVFSEMINSFIQDINNNYINKKINHFELNELKFFCSIISSMIKRKEWSSEKEWRIICIPRGAFHQNINGSLHGGIPKIYLENKTPDTLRMFTNDGHDNVSSKDILKIGCKAGNKDQISYVLSLLYNKTNIMHVSQSDIQTK
jgi:hypothetical protein